MVSADTPFGQVKLGELGAWISRRDKSLRGVSGLWSRGNCICIKISYVIMYYGYIYKTWFKT